jgi:hypothetical protein
MHATIGAPICEGQLSEVQLASDALEAAVAVAYEAQKDDTLKGHADSVLKILDGLRETLSEMRTACRCGHLGIGADNTSKT